MEWDTGSVSSFRNAHGWIVYVWAETANSLCYLGVLQCFRKYPTQRVTCWMLEYSKCGFSFPVNDAFDTIHRRRNWYKKNHTQQTQTTPVSWKRNRNKAVEKDRDSQVRKTKQNNFTRSVVVRLGSKRLRLLPAEISNHLKHPHQSILKPKMCL